MKVWDLGAEGLRTTILTIFMLVTAKNLVQMFSFGW
jgi:hypothetical protein